MSFYKGAIDGANVAQSQIGSVTRIFMQTDPVPRKRVAESPLERRSLSMEPLGRCVKIVEK
jgi:hypothetical protein